MFAIDQADIPFSATVYFEVSAERCCFGTCRANSGKLRALHSALWRIRGFASSRVRITRRAGAWRNTINLCVSASPPRRDVFAGAVGLCMGGFVLGDNIGYLIGKTICRGTITRYGGKIGLTNARISTVEETFSRYGSATVLFARFFPVLRQLNGIVAGGGV